MQDLYDDYGLNEKIKTDLICFTKRLFNFNYSYKYIIIFIDDILSTSILFYQVF